MNKEKNKKKFRLVIRIFLICVIILLIVLLVVLNSSYFNKQKFYLDYLSIEASNYIEVTKGELENKDGTCHINIYSQIGTIDSNSGESEIINNQTWYRQDFDEGVTLSTSYNGIYYIVQMYADDSDTYNNTCKKEFEEIKKTFTFMKDE